MRRIESPSPLQISMTRDFADSRSSAAIVIFRAVLPPKLGQLPLDRLPLVRGPAVDDDGRRKEDVTYLPGVDSRHGGDEDMAGALLHHQLLHRPQHLLPHRPGQFGVVAHEAARPFPERPPAGHLAPHAGGLDAHDDHAHGVRG